MGLVAKVTKGNQTINFYRHGAGVSGYVFYSPPNPPKTKPMMVGDSCKGWITWATKNGYTVDFLSKNA